MTWLTLLVALLTVVALDLMRWLSLGL